MSKIGKWTLGLSVGGVLILVVAISLGDWPGVIIGAILFIIGGFLAKIFYQA